MSNQLHPIHEHSITGFLSRLRVAPRQFHKSLSVWPLLLRNGGAPGTADYIPLAEALAAGTLGVSELDAGGAVPHVRVANRGERAVLFLFGEEIRGAKQNRVANASFLVAPKSELVIDVSCVEAGRWGSGSGLAFEQSADVLSSAIRQKIAAKVADARAQGDGFHADQREVWEDIGERLRFSGTASGTSAYADYRASRDTDLDEVLGSFRPLEGQVGFVAAIGEAIVGAEAIGRPEVFAKRFGAVLRSYAIDAIDAALLERKGHTKHRTPAFEEPGAFLAALARARVKGSASLGLGEDLRIRGQNVTGCALAHGQIVHLTAFPA